MENLSQIFEDSRQTAENYLAYLTRRGEQAGNASPYSLNSVVENVDMAGMVAAMAAKESMASHNSIFQMLHAINEAQGALMDLVIDLRLNAGIGGGGGGVVNGAATAGGIASMFTQSRPEIAAAMAAGGLISGGSNGSGEIKQAELNQPNSLTNKAIRAKEDARKLVSTINYSINPAPIPLTNGPAPFMYGHIYDILPFIGTLSQAVPYMDGVREGYQAAAEARPVHEEMKKKWEAIDAAKTRGDEFNQMARERIAKRAANAAVPNPSTGADEYLQTHLAAMQPHAVQIVTQQSAARGAAPEQTINFNIANDFKGNWQDRRQLNDIGEYLAQQVKERLNSGAPLRSYR